LTVASLIRVHVEHVFADKSIAWVDIALGEGLLIHRVELTGRSLEYG
jgi:hypothetical protein